MNADNEYISLYHETGLWIPGRRIYLHIPHGDDGGEIDYRTTENLIKNIDILHSLGQQPITVIINTSGGYDTDGRGMYDVIRESPCQMIGIAVGECSSSGITVLQAFDRRLSYKSTTFLVHDGSTNIGGTLRDVERRAEAERLARLSYYKLLAGSTGKDSSYWARKLQHDYILNAEQALEEHLIDEII